MPDAAKLVAAIGMAVLAFLMSGQVMGLYPEDMNFGWFVLVNVCIGVLVGWFVLGTRVGHGAVSAINMGLTSTAVFVLWALFVQGANEMVRLAMRNRYDGVFEALTEIFTIGVEYALFMSTIQIWGTAIVGGVIVGLLTEYAWRTWR